MRSSGFPCRYAGCERTFQVEDQTSMAALTAGSAARSEHEVREHDYRHLPLPEAARRTSYVRPRPKVEPAR
ncbi:MAG: hypothetical protein HYU87_11420 [Chloroflexi bacterium]|nr:hypothetical protein [Chloroflexota bacterium]